MIWEIVVAILAGALIGGGCVIIWEKASLGRNAKICVLGMKQTGKTLFFNALHGIYGVKPDETSTKNVPAFKLTIKDSKGKDVVIKLKETQDISGSSDYIATRYEDLIKTSTHVIYFCNICEYLAQDEVKRDVNARLDLINKYVSDMSKVFIVLSYGDMVNDRNEASEKFIAAINGKSFASFSTRMAIVNMTNEDEVEKLIKSIFYVE